MTREVKDVHTFMCGGSGLGMWGACCATKVHPPSRPTACKANHAQEETSETLGAVLNSLCMSATRNLKIAARKS